jgi:inner membrane protein
MASIGHLAVGMLLGRVYPAENLRTRVGALAAGGALALLPDADVLGLALGLSDQGFWGHRGYSHTLAFAGLIAGAVFVLLRRRASSPGLAAVLAFVAVGSHGVLDAMTYDSRGIAFFWPLLDERLTLPLRIIPNAPTGLEYLSWRGVEVTTVELLYFLPVGAAALAPGIKLRRPVPRRWARWTPVLRLGAACLLIAVSMTAAGRYLHSTALVAWLEGPSAIASRIR